MEQGHGTTSFLLREAGAVGMKQCKEAAESTSACPPACAGANLCLAKVPWTGLYGTGGTVMAATGAEDRTSVSEKDITTYEAGWGSWNGQVTKCPS